MEREQATKFMYDLLRLMLTKRASDLFITVGFPPAIKIDGRMTPVSNQPLKSLMTYAKARCLGCAGRRSRLEATAHRL